VTKCFKTDLDNLRMKVSALNVDFSSPSADLLVLDTTASKRGTFL